MTKKILTYRKSKKKMVISLLDDAIKTYELLIDINTAYLSKISYVQDNDTYAASQMVCCIIDDINDLKKIGYSQEKISRLEEKYLNVK